MNKNMILHYLGISAFVFVCPNGDKVGVDFWTPGAFPYSDDTPKNSGVFDGKILKYLLISHDHKDHCFVPPNTAVINGVVDGKVEDGKEVLKLPEMTVTQYASEHFLPSMGRGSKANAVFVFEFKGMRICHLADAFGTILDSQKLLKLKKKVGEIDLLLFPIDGANIKPINLLALFDVIKVLAPCSVIPMHYYNSQDKINFLAYARGKGYTVIEHASEYEPEKEIRKPGELPVFHSLAPAPFQSV